MRTTHIPGGVYADCLPNGARVASIGATVVRGWWDDEGEDIKAPVAMMFNRLSPSGEIASKSHSPGTVYRYNGTWVDTGIDSPGVQGHAWRPDGALVILQAGDDQESMGLRYFDLAQPPGGSLDRFGTTPGWATGSPTYTPDTPFARALGVSRLYEWTQLAPGVFVGQGDQGGTVIQHPRFGHRLLIDGDSRFVQGHYDGATIAIAVSRLAQGDAWCFWLTEAEIANLPVYPAAAPDPEPIPEPELKPQPEPEPTPMYEPIPSHLSVVEEVWNRCTPEQRARHAFVAEAVAFELRRRGLDFYVNQKRGVQGDSEDAISTPHPQGAGGWAIIDVVAEMNTPRARPAWIDVTQATINGGTVGGGRLPRNVLGVGGDDGDPGDEDGGKPQPACECAKQLEELRANQDAQHARIHELLEKVAALEQRPAPVVTLPELVARGRVSLGSVLGKEIAKHVEIPVVPK